MLKKLNSFFSTLTTTQLLNSFLLIGLVLWFMSAVAVYFAPDFGFFLFILGLVAFGFMGLSTLIRKEFPWIIPIKGWLAVVEGVVILVFGWGAAIILTGVMLGGR